MPSSKTLSDSSSDSVPDSSALTICSSRVKQSSNLRSVILFPRALHPAIETAVVQENPERIARPHVACAADHGAVGRPREAVPATQDGERRQRVEAARQRDEAMARLDESSP